jgi:uncharacterized protein (TIGR02001 family)
MTLTSGRSALKSRLAPIAFTLALLAGGASSAQAQVQGKDTAIVPPAPSQVPPAPVFSFSVIGASDYLFRGVSQTENDPAIFGSAKVSYDHFYLAVGAENVDFNNGIKAEYDLSGGWSPSLGKFNFDLGAIRYGYIGAQAGLFIDTTELHGAVSRAIGPITLGGAVNYALRYFGTKRPATYVEGNAAYKITNRLTASGAVGRQEIDAGNSFTTWNVGAGYALAKHISVGARYTDTDGHAFGRLYHSHFVVSAQAGF